MRAGAGHDYGTPLGLGGDTSIQLWTVKQCDAVDALQSTVCVAPHSCSELPNRSIVRTFVRRDNLVVGTLGLEPVSLTVIAGV